MTPLFHAASAVPATAGSPLYDVLPEHQIAIVAVLLLPLAAWVLRLRAARSARVATLVAGYDAAAALVKFTVWLLAISATVHVALALSHEGQTRVLFAIQGVALAIVIGRQLSGRSWRLPAALILVGSIGGYWLANLGGEAPDQLGLATKLVELTALAIVIRPMPGRRVRGVIASTAVVLLVVATATAGWIGAFRASAGAGGDGHAHGHAAGSVATPGSVLPLIENREPTPSELAEAERLLTDVAAGSPRTPIRPLRPAPAMTSRESTGPTSTPRTRPTRTTAASSTRRGRRPSSTPRVRTARCSSGRCSSCRPLEPPGPRLVGRRRSGTPTRTSACRSHRRP